MDDLLSADELHKEKMSRRILQQMLNSGRAKCFVAWLKFVADAKAEQQRPEGKEPQQVGSGAGPL